MKKLIGFMLLVCMLSGCTTGKPGNEFSSQTQGDASNSSSETPQLTGELAGELTGELKLVYQMPKDDGYATVKGETHFEVTHEMESGDQRKLYDASGELVADLGEGWARAVSGGDYILTMRDSPLDSSGVIEECELYRGHEVLHTFYSSEGYIYFDEQDKILYYEVGTIPHKWQTSVVAYDYGNRKLLWEVEGKMSRIRSGPVVSVSLDNSDYILDKWTGKVLSEGLSKTGDSAYWRISQTGNYILDDDDILRYYTLSDELVFEKPLESGESFVRMLASGVYITLQSGSVYTFYDATGKPIGTLEKSGGLEHIYDGADFSVVASDRGRKGVLIIFKDGSIQEFQKIEYSISVSEYSKFFGLCTNGNEKYLLHYETQQLYPVDSQMKSIQNESPNGAYVFVYDENYDTYVIDQAGAVVYKSEHFCEPMDDRYFFESHPDGPLLIPIDGSNPIKLDYEGSFSSINSEVLCIEDDDTCYVYQLLRK